MADSAPLLEVIDDLVPADLHAEACNVCEGKTWYFGHSSHEGGLIRFWRMDLDGNPAFDRIWDFAREKCEKLAGAPLLVQRQYANGQTYGLGGSPHLDEVMPGSYTLLYYPMREWSDHWDGETVFYDDRMEVVHSVRPRRNRAVFFDSRIVHVGRAPSRTCPALRVTVAYKLVTAANLETPLGLTEDQSQREQARRVYSFRTGAHDVSARVQAQLEQIGKSVRLPGFRPGKIPLTVLQERYGSRARAQAIDGLGTEAAEELFREGGLPSSVEILRGAGDGEVELLLTVTHLPDLPDVDLARVHLHPELPPSEAKEQVLDALDAMYQFPVAQDMIERELTSIWKAADAELAAEKADMAAREEARAELRIIAERRVRLGAVLAELARRYGIRAQGAELETKVIDRILADARGA